MSWRIGIDAGTAFLGVACGVAGDAWALCAALDGPGRGRPKTRALAARSAEERP